MLQVLNTILSQQLIPTNIQPFQLGQPLYLPHCRNIILLQIQLSQVPKTIPTFWQEHFYPIIIYPALVKYHLVDEHPIHANELLHWDWSETVVYKIFIVIKCYPVCASSCLLTTAQIIAHTLLWWVCFHYDFVSSSMSTCHPMSSIIDHIISIDS